MAYSGFAQLAAFLSYGRDDATRDHVTISRWRRLVDAATHQRVFGWILEQLARQGPMKGKTMGRLDNVGSHCGMKSIAGRDTQESYRLLKTSG